MPAAAAAHTDSKNNFLKFIYGFSSQFDLVKIAGIKKRQEQARRTHLLKENR